MTTENSLSVPATHVLDNVSTMSIEDFKRMSLTSTSRYSERAKKDGKVDTASHAGRQLSTDDVINRVLTVTSVTRALVPDLDENNNPIPLTDENGALMFDENGEMMYKQSIYPILTFAEAPDCWYNGGTMWAGVVQSWAEESGDNPDAMTFPALNSDLAEIGGIPCLMQWKKSRQGRNYVNIMLA